MPVQPSVGSFVGRDWNAEGRAGWRREGRWKWWELTHVIDTVVFAKYSTATLISIKGTSND